MMTRQFEKLRPSLFDEDEPPVVLATTRMVDLGALLEALLCEIAKALANEVVRVEFSRPNQRLDAKIGGCAPERSNITTRGTGFIQEHVDR
jgi:hypothetical protein